MTQQPDATPTPLTPEIVSAILRDPESPYYPTQITVFCDHCGTERTGDYMVSEDMTSEQRLAVARKYLVVHMGWEHTADGDDFCHEHAGSPAEEQPEGACALCDVVKPDKHALRDHVLNVHPDEFCGIYHEQPCRHDGPERPAAPAAADPSETCGKCKQPFDPADTRFDGRARYHRSPYCRGCISRCHDSEIADHRCVICQ